MDELLALIIFVTICFVIIPIGVVIAVPNEYHCHTNGMTINTISMQDCHKICTIQNKNFFENTKAGTCGGILNG